MTPRVAGQDGQNRPVLRILTGPNGQNRPVPAAAFEHGAAPITLIDGDKLIDLLIEHGIGARKRTIEILEIDATAFAETGVEGEDVGEG